MADTICVLGCGGFIGSHLLERILTTTGYHVAGVDISSAKINHLIKQRNLSFVKKDIFDIKSVRPYIERSDAVISLTALCNPSLYTTVPLSVIDINFTRHLEIVRVCSEMGKWLVHFSTCEVYGKTTASLCKGSTEEDAAGFLLNEDTSPLIMGPVSAQRWSYASAKQLLERLIFAYGFERALKYTIVRPFNYIGPRMDYIPGIDGEGVPRVLACFMDALLTGKPLKLVDGGVNRRCFTYIDDAIDATMAILENPGKAKGQIFNIGNPSNETTIAGLAKLMIDMFKSLRPGHDNEFTVENISSEVFYGKGYEDSDRRVPDITKARRILGWEPKTGLETALRKTITAYIEKYGAVQGGK
jgi:UDP-apiose/xylose synthase